MNTDWTIQGRSHQCAATGRHFEPGEYFHTILYYEKAEFRREDLSEEAFKNRSGDIHPFSHWRSKYEPSPVVVEAVSKQTAEDLLRKYMEENAADFTNARYILALMLERKRILKEREVKRSEDGTLTRIYEHAKTGEIFVIPDPELRLDQVAEVQQQVASQLG